MAKYLRDYSKLSSMCCEFPVMSVQIVTPNRKSISMNCLDDIPERLESELDSMATFRTGLRTLWC